MLKDQRAALQLAIKRVQKPIKDGDRADNSDSDSESGEDEDENTSVFLFVQ
jgi:hypothetical protein